MANHSYTAIREEDYAQSANTLFHFVKKPQYLNDILARKAIVPRYCIENIDYLDIYNEDIKFEEIAVLQKCFCDIPFHKLTERFTLQGEGTEFETLSNNDKLKASQNNTHPDFYGKYAIAFSKKWGEANDLQPIHYLNEMSNYTKDFMDYFNFVLGEDDIDERHVGNVLNGVSFIKPLRGIMNRQFVTENGEDVTIRFWKNFHDEMEWRYVPSNVILQKFGIDAVIANPKVLKLENELEGRAIDVFNESLKNDSYQSLWIKYNYDDIRYIIVPSIQDRVDLIKTIIKLSDEKFSNQEQPELEKLVLISKILVLDEIRKDW